MVIMGIIIIAVVLAGVSGNGSGSAAVAVAAAGPRRRCLMIGRIHYDPVCQARCDIYLLFGRTWSFQSGCKAAHASSAVWSHQGFVLPTVCLCSAVACLVWTTEEAIYKPEVKRVELIGLGCAVPRPI